MRTYAYPARLAVETDGAATVSFRDLPEAVCGAPTTDQALALAAEALDAVILHRLALGEPVPPPSPLRSGEALVVPDPATAARAALAAVMAEQHVSDAALAERLGRSRQSVRRLLNGAGRAGIGGVLQALAALGRPAAVSIADAWPTPVVNLYKA